MSTQVQSPMSAQSSSPSERHFKNATHPAVSTDFKHPYHSYVNIHRAALRVNLAGVRAQTGSAEHRTPKTFHAHDMCQWDACPQTGKVVLKPCFYLHLDAMPAMATRLTGILGTGNDFPKSVESKSLFCSV